MLVVLHASKPQTEFSWLTKQRTHLLVGVSTELTSEGGADGNRVDVGTSLASRGTDSGGEFETQRLKFTIEDTGIGGNLTVVADLGFVLDASSSAPSVVLSP